MKKAMTPGPVPEPKNLVKERGFRDSSRDDRFTRKEAYSTNDYDEENTFRSGRDFKSTKFGGATRPYENSSPPNDQQCNSNVRDNKHQNNSFGINASKCELFCPTKFKYINI